MSDIDNNFYHNRLSKYMQEATCMKSKLFTRSEFCYFYDGECQMYNRMIVLYDFYTTNTLNDAHLNHRVEKEFKRIFRLFKKLYKYEGVKVIYEQV